MHLSSERGGVGVSDLGHLISMLAFTEIVSFPGTKERMVGIRGGNISIYQNSLDRWWHER